MYLQRSNLDTPSCFDELSPVWGLIQRFSLLNQRYFSCLKRFWIVPKEIGSRESSRTLSYFRMWIMMIGTSACKEMITTGRDFVSNERYSLKAKKRRENRGFSEHLHTIGKHTRAAERLVPRSELALVVARGCTLLRYFQDFEASWIGPFYLLCYRQPIGNLSNTRYTRVGSHR